MLELGLRRLEFLPEPAEKSPRRAELFREDAYARPVAEDIVLTEHVDHVEPRLHRADGGQLDPVGDAEVELLVGRIRRVVRMPHRASQPAAGEQIEAEARAAPSIAESRRGRDELAVIGDDV